MHNSFLNNDPYFIRGEEEFTNTWSFMKRTKGKFFYLSLFVLTAVSIWLVIIL